MPKTTNPLTRADLEKARQIHQSVLDENTTLKRVVSEAIAGKRGSARQKAWARAVNTIFRVNALYREAVRTKFRAAGIPTAQR
jgi:hypothetical protein